MHDELSDGMLVPVRVLLAIPKIALGLFLVLAVTGIFLQHRHEAHREGCPLAGP